MTGVQLGNFSPYWKLTLNVNTQEILNWRQLSQWQLSMQHLSKTHLSRTTVLLDLGPTWKFQPLLNLIRNVGQSGTGLNCHNICSCNICPWNNRPELQYIYRLGFSLGISALNEILHGNNHLTSNPPSHTDKKISTLEFFGRYLFLKWKCFWTQTLSRWKILLQR